ncbi:MAG: hypothetical protein ACHQ53_12605 [Polyangiales bacterium]
MAAGRFKVCRKAADRLDVELAGELVEDVIVACEAEVRAQLCVVKQGGVRIAIDLLGLESYSLTARDQLVALQRFLGERAGQTAFLVGSSASRGLALWITHMVEGQVIKSFNRCDDAASWLSGGNLGPSTGVRSVLRARDPQSARPRRRTAG